MGTFNTDIEIGSPEGSRFETVNALVDTGASLTGLSGSTLRELGVVPHGYISFILADGRRIRREVGRTWIRIAGRSEVTLVSFGEEGTAPLLGAYSLQGLFLAVDTANERLIPMDGLLMQQSELLPTPALDRT